MDVRSEIREFVLKQAPNQNAVEDHESLLTSGLIDSLKMLDLISFIEEKFKVSVDEDEMMPDNFESIDAIVSFLQGKLQSVDA